MWGELSSKSGASCLGASFMWDELSWGELSLGRVVLIPSRGGRGFSICYGLNRPEIVLGVIRRTATGSRKSNMAAPLNNMTIEAVKKFSLFSF